MNDDTRRLFERVGKKMGWTDGGALDAAEKKLKSEIGKTRRPATNEPSPTVRSSPSVRLDLSESEDLPDKENQCSNHRAYRSERLSESSDDDFDQFLVRSSASKAAPTPRKAFSASKKVSSDVLVVSSDDDDNFETFLQRVKTPNTKPKKISESGSEDSLKNFIVDDCSSDDDFVETKSSFKDTRKSNTPAARPPPRRPPSQWDSPVFVSESDDDDDDIVVRSTWRTRHARPKPPPRANKSNAPLCSEDDSPPSPPLPPAPSPFSLPRREAPAPPASPKRTLSAPPRQDASASSEEEFTSLLERLKQKNKLAGTPFTPKRTEERRKEPPALAPPAKGFTAPASKSVGETPLRVRTPAAVPKPKVSQTEPRHGPASRVASCKTPGCFLQSLSNPGSGYGRSFKQSKEELTRKLFQLYNTSVFDTKLPVNMSVTWNKKMRKTAGYCITGQERGGGNRYARIELSEKVCDSADRLRDTLIHEMCHAATWLINGVRDGHGNFWKFYARKATVVHPELPVVTRCHSYDIKYKFQYQCTRCQNTIGRHSKSLDTQRFACALCTGQLVLLTPSKPRAPTPFANFVKENYGTVRQELAGRGHAEVMRKLSADFASKAKLGES